MARAACTLAPLAGTCDDGSASASATGASGEAGGCCASRRTATGVVARAGALNKFAAGDVSADEPVAASAHARRPRWWDAMSFGRSDISNADLT